MPIEVAVLARRPSPIDCCPHCVVKPFEPFMRGQVQKTGWSLFVEYLRAWRQHRMPRYCALICGRCKEIVGYE